MTSKLDNSSVKQLRQLLAKRNTNPTTIINNKATLDDFSKESANIIQMNQTLNALSLPIQSAPDPEPFIGVLNSQLVGLASLNSSPSQRVKVEYATAHLTEEDDETDDEVIIPMRRITVSTPIYTETATTPSRIPVRSPKLKSEVAVPTQLILSTPFKRFIRRTTVFSS